MFKSNVKITQGSHKQQIIVDYHVGKCAFQEINEDSFKRVTKIFNDGVEMRSTIVYQEERCKKSHLQSYGFEIFSEYIKRTSFNFGVQHIFDTDGSIILKSLGKQEGFINTPSVTKIIPDINSKFYIEVVLKKMDLSLENFGKIQEEIFFLHTDKNSRVVVKHDEKGAIKEVIVDVGLLINNERLALREEIRPNGHRVKKINEKPVLIMKADEHDFVYQKSTFEYDTQGNSFEIRQDIQGETKKFKNNREIKIETIEVELSSLAVSMDEKRKKVVENLRKAQNEIFNSSSSANLPSSLIEKNL